MVDAVPRKGTTVTTPRAIHLDLDSTLVDFIGGCARLVGAPPDARLQPRSWHDVAPVLGLEDHALWARIRAAGPRFWADLDWLPWGRALLSLCQRHAAKFGCPLLLVTSPCRGPAVDYHWRMSDDCVAGKAQWVNRNAPDMSKNLVLVHDKWRLAAPGVVLIDDAPHNVEHYRAAGADAYQIPSPWDGSSDYTDRHVWAWMAQLFK